MCVIMIAWHVRPEFPLIIIANRDEYFVRDTLSACFWNDAPHVFGGRDAQRGGTWMGISTSGRFAAVTNYRDHGPLRMSITSPESRGNLTADWLKANNETANVTAEEYLESIIGSKYEGYNLIVGDVMNGLWFTSNWADHGAVHRLSPGIHGLSNHSMDAPGWPKVGTAKKQLETLLSDTSLSEQVLLENLFQVLENDEVYSAELLPDTGIDAHLERLLSSMFVKADEYDYGTRASTVVLVHKNGQVRFVERTFGRDHKQEKESEHCFTPSTNDGSR